MAQASRTEVYDVPAHKMFQAITSYKDYPKFVTGVESVEIKDESDAGATVTMNINLMKKISYTIKLSHKKDQEVNWSLVTGDYMKVNNGRWTLKSLGENKTEVTYSLEIEVKGFIPGLSMIEKALVTTNLPLNMQAFAKKAASL